MHNNIKNDEIIEAMTYHSVRREEKPDMAGYINLPFGEWSALGAGLSALTACFRTVTNSVTIEATSGVCLLCPEQLGLCK